MYCPQKKTSPVAGEGSSMQLAVYPHADSPFYAFVGLPEKLSLTSTAGTAGSRKNKKSAMGF
jgi:hypothetical protein